MTTSRTRLLGTVAAAGAMLIAPAAAHADGTKNPKYDHPPKKGQPKDHGNGEAPLNNRRAPVQNCPGGAANGKYSSNPSYYPIRIGRGANRTITLIFDAYQAPDKFDVLYRGREIDSTGWRGLKTENDNNHPMREPGNGSLRVNVPNGTSDLIEVRVRTDLHRTVWKFTVTCPS
ncbi:MAG: hypothetical protein QM809_03900 [Gordonia sp. (in: high G+C Gram-positive bacteria)]|uniref:hypothetical protein n=1 Tax=Gordonia sp. (in: high G+C Gram-positive bacteria) TaxID=84139 RepID=UPI0039E420E2